MTLTEDEWNDYERGLTVGLLAGFSPYIERLVEIGIFGDDREEVCRTLLGQAIQRLIGDGILEPMTFDVAGPAGDAR